MGLTTAPQAKLVLNMFAYQLQNNLVTSQAVTWNEMDNEFDDRNALAVVEQISPRYRVTRTENGVRNLTAGTDGTIFGGERFQVTGTFNANMGWGDFLKITTIGEARENKALMGAVTSMAEQIDAYILSIATLASNNWVGTPGANIAQHLDAAQAYTRLKEEGVTDNDLAYVMNHTDQMLLGDQVIKLPAPDGMSTTAFREGFSGQLGGVKTLFTNQLPVLTVGTRATTGAGAVNGANQNVDYAAVADQSNFQGRYLSQTIALDGFAANATVRAGEVFTIPGVFAYDNRKQALVQPARLQQFTVIEDATATAGGVIAALRISPAIIVPGSGAGDNVAINTAHATVSAAPADNAVLTFLGAPSANLAPRLLIQKEAIVVNTAKLVMPANTPDAMRRRLPRIPLSVRMWPHSDFNTGDHGVRFDVAMNANIRDRRKLTRVNGA
jgi:hypothetical protein